MVEEVYYFVYDGWRFFAFLFQDLHWYLIEVGVVCEFSPVKVVTIWVRQQCSNVATAQPAGYEPSHLS
jgi:hypothetical protein